MEYSNWMLPSSKKWNQLQHGLRRIFYLRSGSSLGRCLREMKRSGVKPIRYLSHLGMIIGEYLSPSATYRSEYIEYSESDIRITITEPFIGSLTSPVKQENIPWGVEKVKAPQAWKWSQGRGIRVAVIDTGIAADHPAIRGNYRGGINILSPSFMPTDYNGHGTHVAGIIAGRTFESGIVGVAPRAHIYAVKAFNRRGSANLSDLLSAINWCIENKMHIVNMSFGMDKLSESLRQAIQVAHRRGILMVAATGNQGRKSHIDFPARYPETIAVTSFSENGKLSVFSNFGKGVDIAAPGDRIPSAWLNHSKRVMSGTSMAVPHVTGTISLLLYLNPYLNPEQVRYILTQSAAKSENLYEVGMLNAYQVLRFYQKVWRY